MAASRLVSLLSRFAQITPGYGQQLTWTDFFAAVSARTFVVRIAVERGKPASLRQLIADDFPSHARIGRPLSGYTGVVFVEADVTGRTIVGWIKNRKGRAGGVSFEVPEPHDSGNFERHSSHSAYAGLGVRWPIARFSLASKAGQHHWPNVGLIVSSGLPTFTSYPEALSFYLYPNERMPINALPDSLIVVRIADTRCWIEHMHFAPTHVKLTLRGHELRGANVELIGPRRQSRAVGSSGRVKMPLPGGPDHPQELIVTRGSGWLDHRYFGQSARLESRPDTTFEPPDWSTQLSILATQGESQVVEYKQQLPATPEERTKLARTVIAFANTLGGHIIYGVAESGGGETRVVGVDVQSHTVDSLTNIVHDCVAPFPAGFQVVQAQVDGKRVVAVIVPRQHKPFFALVGDPPRFFVRRQGSTYAASRDDVRELAEGLSDQRPPTLLGNRWSHGV